MIINKKVFKSTEIFTESQSIRIQPTPEFDGITVEVGEGGEKYGNMLYLDEMELNSLIHEMKSMMEYIKL